MRYTNKRWQIGPRLRGLGPIIRGPGGVHHCARSDVFRLHIVERSAQSVVFEVSRNRSIPYLKTLKQIAMRPKFVIQKHQARTLHFDFRLEKDGVFKSWAVPKGVPEQPGTRRLAIQVEDHSLEYGDFKGTIPPGHYGAGTVEIWDRGRYELREWTDDTIVVTLHGGRCQGMYRLIRYRTKGEREWLLFKQAERLTPESDTPPNAGDHGTT